MSEPLEVPDLSEFAPDPFLDPFLERLQHLERIYRELGTAFGVDEQVLGEARRATKTKDPDSYQEWEHLIFDEEEDDLHECAALRGEFVIVFLALSLREFLKDLNSEARSITSPFVRGSKAETAKKDRDDWLSRVVAEFSRESAIDITAGPGWEDLKEVVLARDAIIHPESKAKYRAAYSQPKYMDNGGEMRLTKTDLDGILSRLREYAEWLRKQVKQRKSR